MNARGGSVKKSIVMKPISNHTDKISDKEKSAGKLKDLFTEGLFRKPGNTNYCRPLNKPCNNKPK
jgi:hypothetical protein